MLFLGDFVFGSADRSSFHEAFGKASDVTEVTVIQNNFPVHVVGLVEIFVDIEYQYLYIRHCGDKVNKVIFEPRAVGYVRQSMPRQRYKFQSDGQFLKMLFSQRMHKYNMKRNR